MAMKTKNLMVFFLAIVMLSLVATVSAASDLATINSVKINDVYSGSNIAVTAGDTITVQVQFTSIVNASDVYVKAELEGTDVDVNAQSKALVVEDGQTYTQTLKMVVPYELKDELSDDLALNIKVWNGDYKTEYPEITLRVQREPYKVDVMSVNVDSPAKAGQTLPVDLVLKNTGYNDLDDLYVTLRIPALNIEKQAYFGDLVSIETSNDDDDETDTVTGRIYVTIPYSAEAGVYALEIEAKNDDLDLSGVKQIIVENDFPSNVIAANSNRKVAVGEEAVYSLLLVNPTNTLKVFEVVTESSDDLTSGVESTLVAVPAGTTKDVKVTAKAGAEGEYNFKVSFLSGSAVVDTVDLSLTAEGSNVTSPIVVLTIVLAIIFVVLLVVLIVLLGKKPSKEDEFGESYY